MAFPSSSLGPLWRFAFRPRMSKIMTWEDLDLEAIATRLEAIGRPSQVGWRK